MVDRFGWIGETRRGALATWLDTQLASWWGDWSTVDAAPERDAALPEEAVFHVSGADVAVASQGPEALAGALVGVGTDRAGALARYIGEEALEDLVQRLSGRKERSRQVAGDELPSSLMDIRLGAVALSAHVAGFHMRVHLARARVDEVVPTAKTASIALQGRREAIGEASVRLVASLDLGDIALSELSELRPGDVIVTHAALDTRATLATDTDQSARIAHAVLGERGGRRALLLIHP